MRITILVVVVLWLIPAAGVLVTSFRPEALADSTGWWTVLRPPVPTRSGPSRTTGWPSTPAASRTPSSTAWPWPCPSTVIPITIAAFAAYAFSWMEFRGRYVLFVLVVGLLVVPLQMALIPILRLYTGGASIGGLEVFPDLDLNGTFLGVWLAHTAFGLPLATYLLRNYIGSLPSSIIESAKIDGADHFTIFWRLVVPLSVPALAAFAIFQFLWVWNDLLVAYVFLGGRARPGCSPSRCPTWSGRGRELAPAHGGGVHHHDPAAHRVLLVAALLRAGADRRCGQGVGGRADRRPAGTRRRRSSASLGMAPLPPQRKWRAITIATLVLVPAFWSMMAGLVALATDDADAAEPAGLNSAAAVAFGLAAVPFVFVVLASCPSTRAPAPCSRPWGCRCWWGRW